MSCKTTLNCITSVLENYITGFSQILSQNDDVFEVLINVSTLNANFVKNNKKILEDREHYGLIIVRNCYSAILKDNNQFWSHINEHDALKFWEVILRRLIHLISQDKELFNKISLEWFKLLRTTSEKVSKLRVPIITTLTTFVIELLTIPDIPLRITPCILEEWNKCLRIPRSHKCKLQTFQKNENIFYKIGHVVRTCGDFQVQSSLIECVLNYIGSLNINVLNRLADNWFIEEGLEHIKVLFLKTSFKDFGIASREFLNDLNATMKSRHVYSVECINVEIDDIRTVPPQMSDTFWADFNFGSQSVSIFCGITSTTNKWTVLNIYNDFASHVVFTLDPEKLISKAVIQLKRNLNEHLTRPKFVNSIGAISLYFGAKLEPKFCHDLLIKMFQSACVPITGNEGTVPLQNRQAGNSTKMVSSSSSTSTSDPVRNLSQQLRACNPPADLFSKPMNRVRQSPQLSTVSEIEEGRSEPNGQIPNMTLVPSPNDWDVMDSTITRYTDAHSQNDDKSPERSNDIISNSDGEIEIPESASESDRECINASNIVRLHNELHKYSSSYPKLYPRKIGVQYLFTESQSPEEENLNIAKVSHGDCKRSETTANINVDAKIKGTMNNIKNKLSLPKSFKNAPANQTETHKPCKRKLEVTVNSCKEFIPLKISTSSIRAKKVNTGFVTNGAICNNKSVEDAPAKFSNDFMRLPLAVNNQTAPQNKEHSSKSEQPKNYGKKTPESISDCKKISHPSQNFENFHQACVQVVDPIIINISDSEDECIENSIKETEICEKASLDTNKSKNLIVAGKDDKQGCHIIRSQVQSVNYETIICSNDISVSCEMINENQKEVDRNNIVSEKLVSSNIGQVPSKVIERNISDNNIPSSRLISSPISRDKKILKNQIKEKKTPKKRGRKRKLANKENEDPIFTYKSFQMNPVVDDKDSEQLGKDTVQQRLDYIQLSSNITECNGMCKKDDGNSKSPSNSDVYNQDTQPVPVHAMNGMGNDEFKQGSDNITDKDIQNHENHFEKSPKVTNKIRRKRLYTLRVNETVDKIKQEYSGGSVTSKYNSSHPCFQIDNSVSSQTTGKSKKISAKDKRKNEDETELILKNNDEVIIDKALVTFSYKNIEVTKAPPPSKSVYSLQSLYASEQESVMKKLKKTKPKMNAKKKSHPKKRQLKIIVNKMQETQHRDLIMARTTKRGRTIPFVSYQELEVSFEDCENKLVADKKNVDADENSSSDSSLFSDIGHPHNLQKRNRTRRGKLRAEDNEMKGKRSFKNCDGSKFPPARITKRGRNIPVINYKESEDSFEESGVEKGLELDLTSDTDEIENNSFNKSRGITSEPNNSLNVDLRVEDRDVDPRRNANVDESIIFNRDVIVELEYPNPLSKKNSISDPKAEIPLQNANDTLQSSAKSIVSMLVIEAENHANISKITKGWNLSLSISDLECSTKNSTIPFSSERSNIVSKENIMIIPQIPEEAPISTSPTIEENSIRNMSFTNGSVQSSNINSVISDQEKWDMRTSGEEFSEEIRSVDKDVDNRNKYNDQLAKKVIKSMDYIIQSCVPSSRHNDEDYIPVIDKNGNTTHNGMEIVMQNIDLVKSINADEVNGNEESIIAPTDISNSITCLEDQNVAKQSIGTTDTFFNDDNNILDIEVNANLLDISSNIIDKNIPSLVTPLPCTPSSNLRKKIMSITKVKSFESSIRSTQLFTLNSRLKIGKQLRKYDEILRKQLTNDHIQAEPNRGEGAKPPKKKNTNPTRSVVSCEKPKTRKCDTSIEIISSQNSRTSMGNENDKSQTSSFVDSANLRANIIEEMHSRKRKDVLGLTQIDKELITQHWIDSSESWRLSGITDKVSYSLSQKISDISEKSKMVHHLNNENSFNSQKIYRSLSPQDQTESSSENSLSKLIILKDKSLRYNVDMLAVTSNGSLSQAQVNFLDVSNQKDTRQRLIPKLDITLNTTTVENSPHISPIELTLPALSSQDNHTSYDCTSQIISSSSSKITEPLISSASPYKSHDKRNRSLEEYLSLFQENSSQQSFPVPDILQKKHNKISHETNKIHLRNKDCTETFISPVESYESYGKPSQDGHLYDSSLSPLLGQEDLSKTSYKKDNISSIKKMVDPSETISSIEFRSLQIDCTPSSTMYSTNDESIQSDLSGAQSLCDNSAGNARPTYTKNTTSLQKYNSVKERIQAETTIIKKQYEVEQEYYNSIKNIHDCLKTCYIKRQLGLQKIRNIPETGKQENISPSR